MTHKVELCLVMGILVVGMSCAEPATQEPIVEQPRQAEREFGGFRFLATGDVPYSEEEFVEYDRLLSQASGGDFAFIVHVGDIKSQDDPCTDEALIQIRDLFRRQPVPVVYTFGDNEWTDCHARIPENLLFDPMPIERLAKIRELFFLDEKVLRLNTLKARHQNENPKFKRYIENFRFERDGVLFVALHVVGSNNNRRTDDSAAMLEYADRNIANRAFLEESLDLALKADVRAIALLIHANPDFESAKKDGYGDFLESVRRVLARFNRPVLCLHGDSHYFRIDKPLRDGKSGQTILHFTRLEVFGSPNVAGVSVTVNPASSEVFSFEPYFLTATK